MNLFIFLYFSGERAARVTRNGIGKATQGQEQSLTYPTPVGNLVSVVKESVVQTFCLSAFSQLELPNNVTDIFFLLSAILSAQIDEQVFNVKIDRLLEKGFLFCSRDEAKSTTVKLTRREFQCSGCTHAE